MVHKKAKSKRMSAAKRYKIEKKAREHHRQLNREAKKNPQRKKSKKDPGIPNSFPFKEQMLQEIEARKEKLAAEKERQKAARRAQQDKLRKKPKSQPATAAPENEPESAESSNEEFEDAPEEQ